MNKDQQKHIVSPSQFLPRGSKYDHIFNDNLKDDYRIILYPYLVKEFAKKSLKYGKQGGHKTKRYANVIFLWQFISEYYIRKF